jgi:hypothetical protein
VSWASGKLRLRAWEVLTTRAAIFGGLFAAIASSALPSNYPLRGEHRRQHNHKHRSEDRRNPALLPWGLIDVRVENRAQTAQFELENTPADPRTYTMVYRPNTKEAGIDEERISERTTLGHWRVLPLLGLAEGRRLGAPIGDDFWAISNERRTKTTDEARLSGSHSTV